MTMTKDELVEKHRFINIDHNWWSGVESEFTTDMQSVGIVVKEIIFDLKLGACFNGHIGDWRLFLQSLGYDNPALTDLAEYWRLSVSSTSSYYHENSVDFGISMPNPDESDDEWFIEQFSPYPVGDFRSTAWLAVLRTVNYNKLTGECIDAFKDHMRDLYKRLEEEYNYLTSDETVWEAIVANNLC